MSTTELPLPLFQMECTGMEANTMKDTVCNHCFTTEVRTIRPPVPFGLRRTLDEHDIVGTFYRLPTMVTVKSLELVLRKGLSKQ